MVQGRSLLWREMPQTKGAQRYRAILLFAGIVAISSCTLAVHSLVRDLVELSISSDRATILRALRNVGVILSACMMGWVSYRGRNHDLAPSDLMVWLMILPGTAAIFSMFLE